MNANISSNRITLECKSNANVLQPNKIFVDIITTMAANVARINSFLLSPIDHLDQIHASLVQLSRPNLNR